MKLYGLDIVISQDRPKYVLPEEICPGVPWPPGFRNRINSWAAGYLGTWNPIKRGQPIVVGGRMVCMHPDDYVALRQHSFTMEDIPCT